MKLKASSIRIIGAGACLAIVAVGGVFVAKPQYDQSVTLAENRQLAVDLAESKNERVLQLRDFQGNVGAIDEEVNALVRSVPLSLAVSQVNEAAVNALPDGVDLVSLSNEAPTAFAPATPPVASLSSPEVPFSSEGGAAEGEGGGDVAPAGFSQIPITITVTASDYNSLSVYLDALAQQERLMKVVQITSTQGGSGVNATIYAYAFANNTPVITKWAATQGG